MGCSRECSLRHKVSTHEIRSKGSKAWFLGRKRSAFLNRNPGHDRHSANGLMGLALFPLELSFCRKRYHWNMSRLVLILLIALLPLRSWSVDRMYVGMAFNEPASHSMDIGSSQGSMLEDCPMMAKLNFDNGAADGEGKAKGRHQSCQLCMSLVATQDFAIKSPPLLPQPHVIPRLERFASAELLRFTKPPIF